LVTLMKKRSKINSDVYSPWKAAHHIDRIHALRGGAQPVPAQLQLIISDLCNHNCSFCAYRMENYTSNQLFGEADPITGIINNNPNRMISYEKCIEILDDCKEVGVKALQYTGGGEPTVHPKHREIFQHTLDLEGSPSAAPRL
jgi:2-iminoacetate synthase ThiH